MEAILECAVTGFDALHRELQSGADINAVSEYGLCALHMCCKHGNIAAVKILIDSGANLDNLDKHGNSALRYACAGGFEDIAVLLVQCGAHTHSLDMVNQRVVWAAVKGDQINKLAHILDASPSRVIAHVTSSQLNHSHICGRYELIDGPPLHRSATSVIYHANDHGLMQEYETTFRRHAESNVGVLDLPHFCECIRQLGLLTANKMNEEVLHTAFTCCDVNHNGAVNHGGFTKYCCSIYGRHRKVVVKFMNNEEQHSREKTMRDISSFDPTLVVPVLATLNEADVIAALQQLQSADYPHFAELMSGSYRFALVMPAGDRSLEDIYRHERPSQEHFRVMTRDLAKALQHMHDRGVMHGDVKAAHVVRLNGNIVLTDLSAAASFAPLTYSDVTGSTHDENQALLGMSSFAGAKFSSGALPPEMFCQLTEEQEQKYFAYWRAEKEANSELWRKIRPFSAAEDGAKVSYVVRTFAAAENSPPSPNSQQVPVQVAVMVRNPHALPYDLEPASPAIDIWSYGVLLFELCSGQSLLRVNRDGDLCDAGEVSKLLSWVQNPAALHCEITSMVQDPAAANLLCLILQPNAQDRPRSMADILGHSYFQDSTSVKTESYSTIQPLSASNAHPGATTEINDARSDMQAEYVTSADDATAERAPAYPASAMSAADNVSLSANTVMQALMSAIESRGDASHNATASMLMQGSVQLFVTKTVGTEGALLRIAHNICVEIPPQAMAPGNTKEVSVELLEVIDRYSKLTVVSPIVRISPCNYQFRRPVFVTLPHCLQHGTKANIHIALFDSAYGVMRNCIDPNAVEYGDQYVRFPIAFASDVVVCFRDPVHARHISTDCTNVNKCQHDDCEVAITALRLNKRQCRYCDQAYCTEHCMNRWNNQFCCDACYQHSWTLYLQAQCVASWANSDIILTMQPCFDRFDCSEDEKVLRCNFKNGVIKCSLQINLNEREFTLTALTNIHMSLKVPSVAVVMLNDATIEAQEPCEWRFNKHHEAPEMF